MKRIGAVIIACGCMFALMAGMLMGCASNNSTVNDEQQKNRAYMSQVNEVMEQLGAELESFVDAVSRGDVVNMHTQSENAFKTLDKLESIEAPEAFNDVKKQYKEGTSTLRNALEKYIALYTEIDAGTFDQSTYDSRIAEIQKLYDEGVSTLKKADEAAAAIK